MDKKISDQYKLQLLLHINSLLIARCTLFKGDHQQMSSLTQEQLDSLLQQHTKRIHCNLQCISQMNQGHIVKPQILEPPLLPASLQQPQDIMPKLYMLLTRMFEVW